MTKADARAAARTRRKALAKGADGLSLIEAFPVAQPGKIIAGFAPVGDEINLWPLLHHLNDVGRTTCLPVTPTKPAPLTFHSWIPESEMAEDRYGVSYPVSGEVLTPNLILVPLLAFTPDGRRLGYGGGYYDRTLAKLRAEGEVFACGVAYAGQEVPDLPTDAHDERLDGILTEDGFRKF